MSFRRLDPPQESQGAKGRAYGSQRGSPGPILIAPSKCPEDGATRKKRSK
jgi:hypothetical protein